MVEHLDCNVAVESRRAALPLPHGRHDPVGSSPSVKVMLRTFLAVVLAAAACTSAPTQTTGTLPPPLTTTTTTIAAGPGQCGNPLLTDERIPSTQLADEIINRFVADRIAGEGAEACLTEEAAQVYASSEFPTCLYSCTDVAALDLPDPPDITSEGDKTLGPLRSILVDYHIDEALVRTMREVYSVQTVRGPDDQRQVLIGGVSIEPESYVDDVNGRRAIEDLLAALSDGAWGVAYALVVNEGASSEVQRRLPDLWGSAPADVLESFCETAMCGGAHEILDSEATSALTRTYQVRFAGSEGPVTVDMPVDMFEGQLSIGQLPPDGAIGESATPLQDLFFPDGYDGALAFVRYDSIQLGGDGWYVWQAARYERNTHVISDSVAFDGIGGVELASLGEGIVGDPAVIAAGAWTLAGVTIDDDEPTVLVTDGRRLIAYRLSDKNLRTIIEDSSDTIACASTGAGSVLVTKVLGDSSTYDLYSFADGEQIAHFEPDGASGCGVLAPDGSTYVYSADVSLHNPQTIVLASAVDGGEIDRWSVLAESLIGSPNHPALVFDGRYAIADLMAPLAEAPYMQNPDLGRRFVVDTHTGDQWMVDTSAQILFPPG